MIPGCLLAGLERHLWETARTVAWSPCP